MTQHFPSSIVLIGMPGAGKSTVGVLLAKILGLGFLDTDLDIQRRAGATLQEILENEGYMALRAMEETVLLEAPLAGNVIATGGSAVYSRKGMARLSAAGPVVYLQADIDTLIERVSANPLRGIASDPALGFDQVYAERTPLYEQAGELVVDAGNGTPEQIALRISDMLRGTAA